VPFLAPVILKPLVQNGAFSILRDLFLAAGFGATLNYQHFQPSKRFVPVRYYRRSKNIPRSFRNTVMFSHSIVRGNVIKLLQ
jgi:hypothetical protein